MEELRLPGCVLEFDDSGFQTESRGIAYYVRAIQEPTAAVNAGGGRYKYDDEGNCISESKLIK